MTSMMNLPHIFQIWHAKFWVTHQPTITILESTPYSCAVFLYSAWEEGVLLCGLWKLHKRAVFSHKLERIGHAFTWFLEAVEARENGVVFARPPEVTSKGHAVMQLLESPQIGSENGTCLHMVLGSFEGYRSAFSNVALRTKTSYIAIVIRPTVHTAP